MRALPDPRSHRAVSLTGTGTRLATRTSAAVAEIAGFERHGRAVRPMVTPDVDADVLAQWLVPHLMAMAAADGRVRSCTISTARACCTSTTTAGGGARSTRRVGPRSRSPSTAWTNRQREDAAARHPDTIVHAVDSARVTPAETVTFPVPG